jgi:hypothetical protein
MFQGTPFNQELYDQSGNLGWDITNIRNDGYNFTGMASMFSLNIYYNQQTVFKGTPTGNSTFAMFYGAESFNNGGLPLIDNSGNGFLTHNVVDMSYMFYNATSFDQSLGLIDITSVVPNNPYNTDGGMKLMFLGSGISDSMFTCTHSAAVSMRAPSPPTMCVRRSAQCDP